jgi:hypothetical protein
MVAAGQLKYKSIGHGSLLPLEELAFGIARHRNLRIDLRMTFRNMFFFFALDQYG